MLQTNDTQSLTQSIHNFNCSQFKGLLFRHPVELTRRLHRRSLRLPTRRKWAQSGYICTTLYTAQAGADAGISWS